MEGRPFELQTRDGATLSGHVTGTGSPALLLHGGPGLPDYMSGCADELAPLFTSLHYTQRGVAPSSVQGPYTIEQHMADSLAVLEAFELEKAWAVGHSWGGHLALHLAVAHPERLLGLVCIDTLGATGGVLPEFHEALRKGLSEEELARLDEIDEREGTGEATSEELDEQLALVWPNYFADPASASKLKPIRGRGTESGRETFASVMAHFESKTLARGVRQISDFPVLFVHGIQDPLPIRTSLETAKRIRGARVARIPGCGHFPWVEQPGFMLRSLRGLIAQL